MDLVCHPSCPPHGLGAVELGTGKLVCKPPLCVPREHFCKGATVMQCGLDGQHTFKKSTCSGALPICVGGQCVAKACKPGTKRCGGVGAVATCAADGTSWKNTPCKPKEGCVAGACKPTICTPGTLRCKAKLRQRCAPSGAAWTTLETCQHGCHFPPYFGLAMCCAFPGKYCAP